MVLTTCMSRAAMSYQNFYEHNRLGQFDTMLGRSVSGSARLRSLGAMPEVISQPTFFEKVAPVTVGELIYDKTDIHFIWVFQINPYIPEFRVIYGFWK